MTSSRRSLTFTAHASLLALVLCAALPGRADDEKPPLPVYLEDSHAGTLQFLASALDLDTPHVLLLVDAHSDSSRPRTEENLAGAIRRVTSTEERDARIAGWRRDGTIQAFDWIAPLMPAPIAQVVWVRYPDVDGGPGAPAPEALALPSGFSRATPEDFASKLPAGLPVVASVDLDAFAGLAPGEQATRFTALWARVVRLPRLAAVSFAVSRPWLADDAEASRLALLALDAALSLAHADLRLEPYGVEGPDRSERAKAFYAQRREPPRWDPDTASPELRSLLLASADRLDVRLDPARWEELLARWRAEGSDWWVALDGQAAGSDGVVRPDPEATPDLRVEGGPPGTVRSVTWLTWTPAEWSFNVLPELPSGKVFAGAAPPVVSYRSTVLARTTSPSLPAARWLAALPGPGHTGVLRVSAELETAAGVVRTAPLQLRRGAGTGFRAGLAEQFGLPYVFGAGFLRRGGLRGPDTGVGNDCANFLVAAWRRSGLRMPWSNPAQLRRHLVPVATGVHAADRVPIPGGAAERGLVVHLGSHVAALWEDRAPRGTLGPEDEVVHHLGGAPEVITLAALLRPRARDTFDLYLGPARRAVAWVAVGGDVMPGEAGAPPGGLRQRLRRADLAVANLETPAGRGGPAAPKRYAFQVPPARLAALRALGLRAVSLANNHAGDHGAEGLAETLRALDAEGLGHAGAGADAASAVKAWVGRARGISVAFVAVNLTDADLFAAGEGEPGVAALPRHAREVADALAAARRSAGCVVALPHWGAEGTAATTADQRRWARWLVAHGATAVVGSGSHVVQGQEAVEGAPVFYSTGNLWFAGRWPAASRRAGLAFLGLDSRGRVVAARLDLPDAGRLSRTAPERSSRPAR